ncbi:MMPL family transporter [Egicoccus sp. AB-alg2]|uniref:MMPL family transporter n=1 Tax=Egicoccus sp. AB-alg2 TaxID=3242693 RepID=UPI00359D060C
MTHHAPNPPSANVDRPLRELVARPVAGLARAVHRAPRLVIAVAVAVTAIMAVASGRAHDAPSGEGMMPDVAEAAAAETISERFGDDREQLLQVVVRSRRESLVGAHGYLAAARIEAAVRDSDAAARIADRDGRPGVITWAFPAQRALAGADPARVTDAEVRAAYADGLQALPSEHAAMATALLPADTPPEQADRALALVAIDTTGLSDDPEQRHDELLAIHTTLADAIAAADLPSDVHAEPFTPELLFAGAEEAFEVEIGRLFTSALLIIVAILAVVYWVRPGAGMSRRRAGRRSAADVLLSTATTFMAIVWMTGAAALLGPGGLDVIGGMNEFTQVIPILLIGLGVDYAIHLTSRFRENLGTGASVTEAVTGSIRTVGGALVLATITTALGFLTNVFNPIPALRDFGVLAAIGIVAAFALTITVLPAARLLLDRRAERAGRLPTTALARSSDQFLPRLMGRTAVVAERAPVATLVVTACLAVVGVYGMTQLDTRFSNTDFVPQDAPALKTLETLQDDFASAYAETTDVLITGEVATPAVHNALVAVHHDLAAVDGVVTVGGIADAASPVTMLAGLLQPGPDGATAPGQLAAAASATGLGDDLTVAEDADVDALYRELTSVAPEAAEMIASDGSGSIDHLRLQVATVADQDRAATLMADLAAVFAPVEAHGVEVVATSTGIQQQVVVDALQESQATSMMLTLVVAMLLLMAVFAYEQRRPALGVITTIPVILVVLWTFGMMAATGIPFGPITATIAALAIGIGLPYAIHMTHRFTEDRRRHADIGAAIRATVRHTGGAMAGSAFTTMAGFGILITSSLVPFRQLGAVTAYAVGFSLLAATLVLPSLLVLWDRWHHRHSEPAPTTEVDEPLLATVDA